VKIMWPFKKKSNPVYKTILTTMFGDNPAWTKKNIANITKAGYENCCTVFACVNERAGSGAGVPWRLFKKPISKGAKKVEIEAHPLLDLMNRPNSQEGGFAFRMKAMAFYLISGNSYLARTGPKQGPPKEMYSIRPDRMKILTGNELMPIRGYRYTVGGQKRDFKFEEILHLKSFSPLDDWYGLSPIAVAGKEIDILGMNRAWNMKLLENDCRPPGALVVEGALSDEQRGGLDKIIEKKMTGYENAGKPLLLEGGVKWEPWAINPKDMDGINSDKVNSRKICSVFNISPELIGDSENKTYSNYKEARKALYIEAVLPDLDLLRDELNNWLTPAFGDNLHLSYDKNSIDAIREELSAVYERQAKAWWRSVNEHRVSTGDDEIGKSGDVILIPANLIPFGDISGNIKEE